MSQVTKIVIAGASGNIGEVVLPGLLESTSPKFHVTAISRPESKAAFPTADNLTVAKGNYEDAEFLKATLQGQDVLIIALGFGSPPSQASDLVKVAAEVGIKYVLPTEFGSDTANPKLVEAVPVIASKVQRRQQIEELGVSKWVGFVTNPWTDFGIRPGFGYGFAIDYPNKKATVYTGQGVSKFYTTTLAQVGRAVVAFLKLSPEKQAAYANKMVYIKSFHLSQRELLESIQSVVGSDGWDIKEKDLQEYISEGKQQLLNGDRMGAVALIYGNTLNEGVGNVYTGELANEALGLPEEDLTDAIKEVVSKA